MATIYPDADLRNADWPKRTPDTLKDLEKQAKKEEDSKLKSIRDRYKRKGENKDGK